MTWSSHPRRPDARSRCRIAATAIALSLCALASLAARAGEGFVRVTDTSHELGTSYEIVLVVPAAQVARAREALDAARALTRDLESRLSEWQPESEISRVNARAAGERVAISRDLRQILRGSREVWRATDGAFDPTWRALAPLWERAADLDIWPDETDVAAARAGVGFDLVDLDEIGVRFAREDVVLGVAGVAKGWVIDHVHASLHERFPNVLVNIGGDLRVSGRALETERNVFRVLDPFDPARVVLELPVGDGAVATSGTTFRSRLVAGRAAGHILDPRTGYPPSFEGSVTVLTAEAAMADALATGLFVLGPDEGLARVHAIDGVEAIYVTREGVRASLPIDAEESR